MDCSDVEYWKKEIIDALADSIYETLIWDEEEGSEENEGNAEYQERIERYKQAFKETQENRIPDFFDFVEVWDIGGMSAEHVFDKKNYDGLIGYLFERNLFGKNLEDICIYDDGGYRSLRLVIGDSSDHSSNLTPDLIEFIGSILYYEQ